MPPIASPMEHLELQDGQSRSFRVLSWEQDTITITPEHRPEGKTLKALRVHVPPEDKATFPHYWDISQQTLVAQLEPHLKRPDLPRLRFTVTARGLGPKKRFQLDVVPS